MKKWGLFLATLIFPALVFSSNVATQTVTISISPVTHLVLVGNDPVFNMTPNPITDAQGTTSVSVVHADVSYSFVCTKGCHKKIIGQLDMEMPEGVQLRVYLAAPSGATSSGFQILGVTESDLVTNISSTTTSGNADITYELSVDFSKVNPGAISRDIIYTFMDD